MDMNDILLLPCRCCGKIPEIQDHSVFGYYKIKCGNASCRNPFEVGGTTKANAAFYWNQLNKLESSFDDEEEEDDWEE